MKKKLCLLLVLALSVASLTACGDKNADIKPVDTKPTEATQLPVESQPEETKPTESETVPEVEEDFQPGDVVEIVPSDKPASEGEFGSSVEFSGIYELAGYASMDMGSIRSLNLTLRGIDNNNFGDFEATNTSIPNYITDFDDYIYLQLTFDNNGLVDWKIIDKVAMIDLGQATESQLTSYLFPETKYEEVPAGLLPETIYLSEFEAGKMYVFDLETTEDSYVIPEIINDTDIPVLLVSTRIGDDDEFNREIKVNNVIESNAMHFSFGSAYADKIYMAVMESTTEYVVRTADCFMLSKCEIGEEIDFGFEDFIYNDTDKTITVYCEDTDTEYVLKAGEIAECSWMNDIIVKSAE